MTGKDKHISEKEFQRYLNDQMTDAERNAVERELQKHPFEAEALEGFQQISSKELSKDLHDLKSDLFSKKRKSRYRYWAAAATILLLVTSGIIWFQLIEETFVPKVAENKTAVKEDTVVEPQINSVQRPTVENEITPNVQTEVKDMDSNTTLNPEISKEIVLQEPEIMTATAPPTAQNKSLNIVDNSVQMQSGMELSAPVENSIANMKFQDEIKIPNNPGRVSITDNYAGQNQAIKIDDSVRDYLPQNQNHFVKASVVADKNEEFTNKVFDTVRQAKSGLAHVEFDPTLQPADTNRILSIMQDQSGPDLIVIRGIGTPEVNKAVSGAIKVESNVSVWPKGGMELFEKYLEEKAVLPDNYRKNRAVINLKVNFDQFGDITGFTNENEADSLLFELAKKMVKNGPDWSPEIQNGRPVTSEKELKIVFRKKK